MTEKPAHPKQTLIRTPDYRLRVFISSTLKELADEREAVRQAILHLHLVPIMFEAGARPHPARDLYQAYLAQSHVFIGLYWQSYGWVAPDMVISGLEDEYNLSAGKPRLIYLKHPAPAREPGLNQMLARLQNENTVSYKRFATAAELAELVEDDLALLLTETFETTHATEIGEPALGLPSGTVTFLFTDIEGSSTLWEREPEAMHAALARHDATLQQAVAAHRGIHYKTIGDAIQAAFALPADALAAALAAQRELEAAEWPTQTPLRVRMGLHTGPAELAGADYVTTHTLNRVARIMAAAHGGQVVLSSETAVLLHSFLPPDTSLRDLGQHRMKGMIEREHLYQLLAPGLPAVFPPLATLDATPNNLPVQLTSFVGRAAELGEARELLRETRLLTLTGSGGTGKTRLALQIAATALPDYPEGAWLVELAPLADPAYLAPALAAVFGVREQAGRPLREVVTDYLRAKRLLLVLDNCEHLVEACAQLADDLLHACPRLKILASSREALGVAGETAYRVPSLNLPDPRLAAATRATLAHCEAVRLFVERAHAAQPRFDLTDGNAPAVAALCRRLDGIPLALELAAARVRVLPVEQILARLNDRFRLLVGGSRTALPRQQTLRALIDWSYDLLPEEERRLLRALSVFVGGATMEAVEAVALDLDVLSLLTQLVNKSLVAVEEDGPTARYRLLETIGQYAREKLMDAPQGEALAARNRHLSHFLKMTEAAEPRLEGADMIAALDELEVEQDNLRAALEWALDPNFGDRLPALRLVSVLGSFWARRTSVTEGRRWVQAALDAAGAGTSPTEHPSGEPLARGAGAMPGATAQAIQAAQAHALATEAELLIELGDHPGALAAAKASMALARPVGATHTMASALSMGATAASFLGDAVTARAWTAESQALSDHHGYLYEQLILASATMMLAMMANEPIPLERREAILRVARATGNPYGIAIAFRILGHIARTAGDYEAAYTAFAQAAQVFQRMRDREFYNACRAEMGHARRMQGRHAEAAPIYAETLPVWQALGRRASVARELECLAFIAATEGPAERAAQLFGAAEALREQTGASMMFKERSEYDAAVAQLRARAELAVVDAAWAQGRTLGMDEAVAYALAEGSGSSASSHSSQT